MVKRSGMCREILIVAHAGISIPVSCYFKEIPHKDTLISLGLGNCEVGRYEWREKELGS